MSDQDQAKQDAMLVFMVIILDEDEDEDTDEGTEAGPDEDTVIG